MRKGRKLFFITLYGKITFVASYILLLNLIVRKEGKVDENRFVRLGFHLAFTLLVSSLLSELP